MLKKIIVTLAVFSLVTVSATVPTNNLKQAINEFNFAVTVDWDQRDTTFYNQAVDNFKRSIAKLSEEGMTNEEIIQGVLASVKNKKQAAELQRMVGLLRSDEMTKKEVINFISEKVRLTQNEGAGYQGRGNGGMGMLLVVGLLVGVAIYLIREHHDDDDRGHGNGHGEGSGSGSGHGSGSGSGSGCYDWPMYPVKNYDGGYGC